MLFIIFVFITYYLIVRTFCLLFILNNYIFFSFISSISLLLLALVISSYSFSRYYNMSYLLIMFCSASSSSSSYSIVPLLLLVVLLITIICVLHIIRICRLLLIPLQLLLIAIIIIPPLFVFFIVFLVGSMSSSYLFFFMVLLHFPLFFVFLCYLSSSSSAASPSSISFLPSLQIILQLRSGSCIFCLSVLAWPSLECPFHLPFSSLLHFLWLPIFLRIIFRFVIRLFQFQFVVLCVVSRHMGRGPYVLFSLSLSVCVCLSGCPSKQNQCTIESICKPSVAPKSRHRRSTAPPHKSPNPYF